MWCGARIRRSKSNAVNLILKAILYHFFTCGELEAMQKQPQHTKTPENTATMVAEPLATQAASKRIA
jgi:hypothetical protein